MSGVPNDPYSCAEAPYEYVTTYDPTAGPNYGQGAWVTNGLYGGTSVGATGPGPMTAAKAAVLIPREYG